MLLNLDCIIGMIHELLATKCNHKKKSEYYFCRPRLPILLPAATGQRLEMSGQMVQRDGQIFYNIMFENNTDSIRLIYDSVQQEQLDPNTCQNLLNCTIV